MTDSIDVALVQQFSDQVHIAAQQMRTRLRGRKAVIERMVTGRDFFYDGLGESESVEITGRHEDTKTQDIEHLRRMGTIRHFAHTFLLDDMDMLETIIDPQSQYAAAVARAMYKRYDRLVVEAATASVQIGRKGETTKTASQDGVITIAHGGTGLTYAKLLQVNQNFADVEIGEDLEEEFLTLATGQQNTDMMNEAKLTSKDYRNDYVIEGGKVRTGAGQNFVYFGGKTANPILPKVSTTRSCLSLAERSICVGIGKEISLKINERPDKNNSIQVQAKFYLGAVRTEGARVQVVQCTES